ncbi:MAG: divergent polysaccharide deacetylase family protein [Alphaproteobacteria bacterium]|nr:divergent polysaccharide deacetylase family protein [Alphaproteobacteria bacterium]
MIDDDLRTPLQRQHLKSRFGLSSVSALQAATFTVVALGVGLVGWLSLNNDPLGGEPVVTVQMLPSDPVLAAAATDLPENTPTKGTMRVYGSGDEPVELSSGVTTNSTDGISRMTRIQGSTELTALDRQFEVPPEGAPEEDVIITGAINTSPPALRLRRAPIKGLFERTSFGPLPKVSGKRTPAKAYARPVNRRQLNKSKGKIAIVIGGMGLSSESTKKAVRSLPGPVTLAFAPYGKGLQRWITKARRRGHEILLQLPMEPFNYPATSPGPNPLLTSLQPQENLNRLKHYMGRFTGYAGVTNYMGAKFTSEVASLGPVLGELKRRGLTYLDDGTSGRSKSEQVGKLFKLGVARADKMIDRSNDPVAIRANLEKLEKIALRKGTAVAVGTGLPETITEVSQWANTLAEKGIVLVPVSELYAR